MGEFLKKHKQLLAYSFWGAANTVVNYSMYFLSTRLLHLDYVAANMIAWIVSVLFAFSVNKAFVFESKNWKPSIMLPELAKFVGARFFSGFFETAVLWLCVDIGDFHDGVVKISASIVVVIVNYLFSKLFIFRSGR